MPSLATRRGLRGLGENSGEAARLGRELFASAKSPEEIFATLKPAVDTKFAFAHRRAEAPTSIS